VDTNRGVDRGIKLQEVIRGDYMLLQKPSHNGPYALINHKLAHDKHWKRNQESYVGFYIAKEGELCTARKVDLSQRQGR
jgi:hypothetical protein